MKADLLKKGPQSEITKQSAGTKDRRLAENRWFKWIIQNSILRSVLEEYEQI
jgi:hypothetical protein